MVTSNASATADAISSLLVRLKLVTIAVIVRAARIVLLLFSSNGLLLVVDCLLELACFRLYLGLLLFLALFHLLFFGQDCLSGVVVQVDIHVGPLFE